MAREENNYFAQMTVTSGWRERMIWIEGPWEKVNESRIENPGWGEIGNDQNLAQDAWSASENDREFLPLPHNSFDL